MGSHGSKCVVSVRSNGRGGTPVGAADDTSSSIGAIQKVSEGKGKAGGDRPLPYPLNEGCRQSPVMADASQGLLPVAMFPGPSGVVWMPPKLSRTPYPIAQGETDKCAA